MIGVILAAGKGTRMEPFSARYPKPILPICNSPLLCHQIEMMKRIGIEEIIVVIGHLGHEIAQALGNGIRYGVKIRYVEQRETLGIAHALGKLEPYISSDILLTLGDVFLVTEDIESMKDIMAAHGASAVLAAKREENPEVIKRNFSILLGEGNRVKRVTEKPRYPTSNIKGCGLYLFDQRVFDAIRRTPRTAMRDEYEITDTIQILIEDELPVLISEVVSWDMNITFPADVLACNLYQLQRLGKKALIGNEITLHPDAVVENCVIGDGVVVRHPIRISNCVVFPYTTVTSTDDVDRFVLSPEHQIDCRQLMSREPVVRVPGTKRGGIQRRTEH
jgi:dTDP-glucose pyrophosphorylase